MLVGLVTGERRLELREMPQPVPTPGKAVVEIAYCGICGTDLHAFQSGEPYNPAICGHEWTGRVSAVGAQTSHVREGDRVAIGAAVACGSCATCRRGDAAHCETAFAGMIGIGPLAAPHGGFASAIAIDASRLYHVDLSSTTSTRRFSNPQPWRFTRCVAPASGSAIRCWCSAPVRSDCWCCRRRALPVPAPSCSSSRSAAGASLAARSGPTNSSIRGRPT